MLPTDVGFTHECVVPMLRGAVVDKDVHATFDSDLERRREVHSTPHTGAAFTPDEHSFAGLHDEESRSLGRADQPAWPTGGG